MIGGGAAFPTQPIQIPDRIAVLEAVIRSAEADGALPTVAQPAKLADLEAAAPFLPNF